MTKPRDIMERSMTTKRPSAAEKRLCEAAAASWWGEPFQQYDEWGASWQRDWLKLVRALTKQYRRAQRKAGKRRGT